MRNRVFATAGTGVVLLTLTWAVAHAAPAGSLKPVQELLHGSLSNANDVTVAPDGEHVYGVGYASNEIGVYSRNPNTGAIEPEDATEGDGLLSPNAIVISPNGDFAYVAGNVSDSVHAYERNAFGTVDNIDSEIDGDGGVDGLAGAYDVAISRDGNHVYATGSDDDAVALMSVASDGELQWSDAFINGGEDIEDMETPRGIAISPNGKNVYVAGANDGSVVTFKRFGGSGQLDFVESDTFFSQSEDVAVSADGTRVYVGFDEGIRTFRRNKATGALILLGLTTDPPEDVTGIGVSPDGGNVYANNGDLLTEGISTLATTRNAKLRFVENDEVAEFTQPTAVAVSADGRHVYLAGGTAGDGHIAVFSRQPVLELKGGKKQNADKLKVKAECSADCKVTLKGSGLEKATEQLKAGKPEKIKLELKSGAQSGDKITIKGKAKAGNRSDTDKLKIGLK